MFLQNKYTKTYKQIIENSKGRISTEYFEKHHIIPKSMGGSDFADNIVKLTAREHFICHWLLTKMVDSEVQKTKLTYALNAMMNLENNNQTRYKITSRKYALLRENFSEVHSKTMIKNNPMHDPEIKKRHADAIAKRGATKGNTGNKHSEETKAKMRKARAKQVITEETKQKLREINLNRTYKNGTSGKKAYHDPVTRKTKFFLETDEIPSNWVKGGMPRKGNK